MRAPLVTLVRANARASWRKYALTGAAVGISAFFLAMVILLSLSFNAAFDAHYEDRVSRSDAVVVPQTLLMSPSPNNGSDTLTTEQVQRVRNDPHVEAAWELVEESYIATGTTDKYFVLREVPTRTDMFPYAVNGRMPVNEREVVVSEHVAADLHLNIGDTLRGNSTTRHTLGEYRIVGTFKPAMQQSDEMISVYAGGLSLTRPGASSDAIQGLAIKLKPGSSLRDLIESTGLNGFGGANPGGHAITVITPHQYADAMRGIQHIVLVVLTSSMLSFAILAVLVSAFVISNTLNVLMAQRTRELSLLRTVGMNKRSLLALVLGEAAIMGVVSSLAGIVLAYILFAVGTLLLDRSSRFSITISTVQAITKLVFSSSLMPAAITLAVCCTTTLIAALLPAVTAMRISPVQGLRQGTKITVHAGGRVQTILGTVFFLLATGLVAWGLFHSIGIDDITDTGWQKRFIFSALGIACLLVALVFLAYRFIPLLVRGWAALIARTLTGEIARANALRSPKRTVATGRALLVGAVLVGVVLSGRATLESMAMHTVDQQKAAAASLYFGAPSALPTRSAPSDAQHTAEQQPQQRADASDPSAAETSLRQAREAAQQVRSIADVSSVSLVEYAGGFDYLETEPYHRFVQNRMSEQEYQRLRAEESAASLANTYAVDTADITTVLPGADSHLLDGDTVALSRQDWESYRAGETGEFRFVGPTGEIKLKPVPSNLDNHSPYVSRATAAKVQDLEHPRTVEGSTGGGSQLIMQTKPLTGNKAKELRENLQHIASKHQGHYVLGTVDTRAALTQSMDYTVYIYMALLSLTLLISMLGVANTIALSGYERAHENALLRVLGLSRTQLRSVVIMEAVLITFATVTIGLAGGTIIGFVGARAMVPEQYELVYTIPWVGYGFTLLVSLVAAILCSFIPAVRVSRRSPVEGLRTD